MTRNWYFTNFHLNFWTIMSLLNKASWRIISMAVSGHSLLVRTIFRFCRIFLDLLDLFVFLVWHIVNYSHFKWHWNSVKKWLPSWSFNVGAISTLRSLYWKLVSNLRPETSIVFEDSFCVERTLRKRKVDASLCVTKNFCDLCTRKWAALKLLFYFIVC